jgi:hypothetical protein
MMLYNWNVPHLKDWRFSYHKMHAPAINSLQTPRLQSGTARALVRVLKALAYVDLTVEVPLTWQCPGGSRSQKEIIEHGALSFLFGAVASTCSCSRGEFHPGYVSSNSSAKRRVGNVNGRKQKGEVRSGQTQAPTQPLDERDKTNPNWRGSAGVTNSAFLFGTVSLVLSDG